MMTDLFTASRAAEQAAYAAGTHLQTSRSRLSAIVYTHEAATDVMRIIEDEVRTLVRDVVLRQFPDHGFIAEKLGDEGKVLLAECRPTWVVDPLDGATNYQRGYPQYAVSIALVEDGEPVIGVVYDPCRNEFFGAIRGSGAVLNGQAIRCAKPREAMHSLAATVFPRPGSVNMPAYMSELGRVLGGFGGVRRSGSMTLELAYLAAARLDAFWEHDMGASDAAAGIALLRESGALIYARDGRPLLSSHSLLACTPQLFEPFLSLLANG
jgi:myo-inositol-1(or 4)-monophosphatase